MFRSIQILLLPTSLASCQARTQSNRLNLDKICLAFGITSFTRYIPVSNIEKCSKADKKQVLPAPYSALD